jgi:N-carbamoyl-D-amino-acid hydrolase
VASFWAGWRTGIAVVAALRKPTVPDHDEPSHIHNELVMQLEAYQNGTWVVGVAKAGEEEGVTQIGNSIIVAPSGEIVAACTTTSDELAMARCDLDLCTMYKSTKFNFARHREPDQYRLIIERKGAIAPSEICARAVCRRAPPPHRPRPTARS